MPMRATFGCAHASHGAPWATPSRASRNPRLRIPFSFPPGKPDAPSINQRQRDEARDRDCQIAPHQRGLAPEMFLDEARRVRESNTLDLAEGNRERVAPRREPRRGHVGERGRADGEEAPAQPALVELGALAEKE